MLSFEAVSYDFQQNELLREFFLHSTSLIPMRFTFLMLLFSYFCEKITVPLSVTYVYIISKLMFLYSMYIVIFYSI